MEDIMLQFTELMPIYLVWILFNQASLCNYCRLGQFTPKFSTSNLL